MASTHTHIYMQTTLAANDSGVDCSVYGMEY